MMSRLKLCLLLVLGAAATLQADTAPILTGWDQIRVEPMKTSIYFGNVTLTPGVFERKGSTLSATYEAKVFPWFFWSETGRIVITLKDTDLANLAKGEKAEFTGDAANQKNKPRKVTGYAQPVDTTTGKFKVRIMANGVELVFKGTYRFGSGK
jgi:hypothetical protein